MTTEEDFQAALDANPDDWQTRLVFADWLQDRDDPRAEGYRALGALQRFSTVYDADVQDYPWFKESIYTADERRFLPDDWFAFLKNGVQTVDWDAPPIDPRDELTYGRWLDYRSRREAEDAAALAFAKLPTERRAELLEGVTV